MSAAQGSNGGSPFGAESHPNAGLALSVPEPLLEAVAERVADRLAERLDAMLAPPPEGYLDVDRAAAYLCARKGRIYELVEQGRLAAFRDGRRLLFTRADLDAALDRKETSE